MRWTPSTTKIGGGKKKKTGQAPFFVNLLSLGRTIPFQVPNKEKNQSTNQQRKR